MVGCNGASYSPETMNNEPCRNVMMDEDSLYNTTTDTIDIAEDGLYYLSAQTGHSGFGSYQAYGLYISGVSETNTELNQVQCSGSYGCVCHTNIIAKLKKGDKLKMILDNTSPRIVTVYSEGSYFVGFNLQ